MALHDDLASNCLAWQSGTVCLPSGRLYMLDMGEPVKILDLANALIRSRGLRPGKDIEVVFTGLRHGERLTEDLLGPGEGWRSTSHPSVKCRS